MVDLESEHMAPKFAHWLKRLKLLFFAHTVRAEGKLTRDALLGVFVPKLRQGKGVHYYNWMGVDARESYKPTIVGNALGAFKEAKVPSFCIFHLCQGRTLCHDVVNEAFVRGCVAHWSHGKQTSEPTLRALQTCLVERFGCRPELDTYKTFSSGKCFVCGTRLADGSEEVLKTHLEEQHGLMTMPDDAAEGRDKLAREKRKVLESEEAAIEHEHVFDFEHVTGSGQLSTAKGATLYKKYRCLHCGYVFSTSASCMKKHVENCRGLFALKVYKTNHTTDGTHFRPEEHAAGRTRVVLHKIEYPENIENGEDYKWACNKFTVSNSKLKGASTKKQVIWIKKIRAHEEKCKECVPRAEQEF